MLSPAEIRELTEREISEAGCLAPCAFLARLGRLDPRDLQDNSCVGRLVDRIYGDLSVVAREIQIAVEYARKLGLREEPQPVSMPVGTCAELPDDRWAMTAWRRPADAQMDLFFDNPGRSAAAQLKSALASDDAGAALEHLDTLESVDPSHPLVAAAPPLIAALQADIADDSDTWDTVHTAASLARIALGDDGSAFVQSLWRRFARAQKKGSSIHLAALEQATAWQELLGTIADLPAPSPETIVQAIHAARACGEDKSAIEWLIRLCCHPQATDANIEPVLDHPIWETVADDWYERGLDRLPWPRFPCFLALRGHARNIPDAVIDDALAAAIRVAHAPADADCRAALRSAVPDLFSALYSR